MDESTLVVIVGLVALLAYLAIKRMPSRYSSSVTADQSKTGGIHAEFRQCIHNKGVRDRLLRAEMAKHPNMSEEQCIQRVLDAYRRDRR